MKTNTLYKRTISLVALFLCISISGCCFAEGEFDQTQVAKTTCYFAAVTEDYAYFNLSSMYEQDLEDGSVLELPDYAGKDPLGVTEENDVILLDMWTGGLLITNFYNRSEEISLDRPLYGGCYCIGNGKLYYTDFAGEQSVLISYDLETKETKELLQNIHVRCMLAKDDVLWYSDNTGLFKLDDENTELVIDSDVSYFQITDERIYYVSASTGTIRVHDIATGTDEQINRVFSETFAFNADGTGACYLKRNSLKIYWYDAASGTSTELELPEGETYNMMQVVGDRLFIQVLAKEQTDWGASLTKVYEVISGQLNEVFSEVY